MSCIAIRWLLANGAQRVAYVDVDVHHGDGVQAAFWDDPRVLTISLHQHPATLFPGTGLPGRLGARGGRGQRDQRRAAARHGRRRVAARVRRRRAGRGAGVRTGRPGQPVWLRHPPRRPAGRTRADRRRSGRGADLDAQLAHESAGGRWVALGGGGYGVVRCVPRTWTNLIAQAAGAPVDPAHRRFRRAGRTACAGGAARHRCRRRWARATSRPPGRTGRSATVAARRRELARPFHRCDPNARSTPCSDSTLTIRETDHPMIPPTTDRERD